MDATNKIIGFQPLHLVNQRSTTPPQAAETGTASAEMRQSGALETRRPVDAAQLSAEVAYFDRKDPAGHQRVQDAVKGINEFFQSVRRTLQFTVDKDTGRTVIQIRDSQTNEVIRQIPQEDVLKLAKRLDEVQGLLFQEKA